MGGNAPAPLRWAREEAEKNGLDCRFHAADLTALPGDFAAFRTQRRPHGDVPLAPLTTFHIGGPADVLYRARTPDELAHALAGAGAGHDGRFRAAYLDVVATVTNLDPTERRGTIHVDQLRTALSAGGLDVSSRGWPAPPPRGRSDP